MPFLFERFEGPRFLRVSPDRLVWLVGLGWVGLVWFGLVWFVWCGLVWFGWLVSR